MGELHRLVAEMLNDHLRKDQTRSGTIVPTPKSDRHSKRILRVDRPPNIWPRKGCLTPVCSYHQGRTDPQRSFSAMVSQIAYFRTHSTLPSTRQAVPVDRSPLAVLRSHDSGQPLGPPSPRQLSMLYTVKRIP